MKNKLPILICFGTRPEWLKVKPLIKLMNRDEYQLLFTGQHVDLLKAVTVDYKIKINDSDNRLDSIISDCMLQFPNGEFRGILVQGDTGSAFGCTLAAFNRQIKIYYLEAGLRSRSLQHPFPEEGYRQMIARIADVNFAPTELSYSNLVSEGVLGDINEVGNTVLDNLIDFGDPTYENFVLVTLHRRENHNLMSDWFTEINNLAIANSDLEFILPIHPNPNVQKWKHLLTNVNVVEPMEHTDMILHIKKCKFIISDSGGIQEEATFFNKKVIVCRETTERPEGIGTGHLHLCKSPKDLKDLFGTLKENSYICKPCPYGDGRAAEKIKKILDEEL
jgi:UDP-N-acetylglucosamine 2-epimerase (non-hydrolysing)